MLSLLMHVVGGVSSSRVPFPGDTAYTSNIAPSCAYRQCLSSEAKRSLPDAFSLPEETDGMAMGAQWLESVSEDVVNSLDVGF